MLYTLKEAQEILRISDTGIWNLMDEGILEYVQFKPQSKRFITQKAIDELIKKSTKRGIS